MIGVAGLLAVQVIRQAAVDALASGRPEAAAKFWNGHPAVQTQLGLLAIAEAARQGHAVQPATLDRIYEAARKAPLDPRPFLVRGVQAQLAGDTAVATKAYQAAELRDARSLPARYFLADLYLRTGDVEQGLGEIGALAQLVPQGADKVGPYVAAFAGAPVNWPALRDFFSANPAIASATLTAMAADPAKADVVLALAPREPPISRSAWLPILLGSLTAAGDYAKARQIWAGATGARGSEAALLFDPDFTRPDAPEPFNWSLTSSPTGLAERQQGSGLHVIFYGQQDGVLASQLLVLPPGRYRLSTQVTSVAAAADGLRWSLSCAQGGKELASRALPSTIGRPWTFEVPPSCRAQQLQLVGSAADVPQQADVTIRAVRLARAGR